MRERAEGEPSASEPKGAMPSGRQGDEIRAISPGGALRGPGGELEGERRYPHPTSAARSANMKGNRRADTKPELALRRALHGQGYRYRKDFRLDLDGVKVRPDIVFTARRVAVFVDGCFWHCCPDHGSQPAANTWYWEPKLRRNVERDRAADAALGQAGWTVVRLWEHEALDEAVAAVARAVSASPARLRAP